MLRGILTLENCVSPYAGHEGECRCRQGDRCPPQLAGQRLTFERRQSPKDEVSRNYPRSSCDYPFFHEPRDPFGIDGVLILHESPGMPLFALLPKNAEEPRIDRAPDNDPRFMSDVLAE